MIKLLESCCLNVSSPRSKRVPNCHLSIRKPLVDNIIVILWTNLKIIQVVNPE